MEKDEGFEYYAPGHGVYVDWESAHAPEPDYPETYYCECCCVVFWDGNRRGHYFNGEDIVCPNDEGDDDDD